MIKFLVGLLVLLSSFVLAQGQQRYIGRTKAHEIALQQVPGGRIKSTELEKEHGKMIYSMDVRTSGGKTKEVNVDAFTGAVVGIENETPKDEAREKAEDKKKKDH